jgi:ribosomal protein L29
MKLNDKKALRELDIAALNEKVASLQKEYAVSKMHFGVGKLKNIRVLPTLRHTIATVKTIITEKENIVA